jgi:hypothetical protein
LELVEAPKIGAVKVNRTFDITMIQKGVSDTARFAVHIRLTTGNYTLLFDEFVALLID